MGAASPAEFPSLVEVFFSLGVVLFEEGNDADVVFERNDVRFGESGEGRHLGLGGMKGAKDVL